MTLVEVMPDRTLKQKMDALEVANEIRSHRAEVKRRLKRGELTMFDVYEDGLCDSMKVRDVLLSLPKFGRVKADRGMYRLLIAPSKTVGGLTLRQKTDLAVAVHSGDPVSCWRRADTWQVAA